MTVIARVHRHLVIADVGSRPVATPERRSAMMRLMTSGLLPARNSLTRPRPVAGARRCRAGASVAVGERAEALGRVEILERGLQGPRARDSSADRCGHTLEWGRRARKAATGSQANGGKLYVGRPQSRCSPDCGAPNGRGGELTDTALRRTEVFEAQANHRRGAHALGDRCTGAAVR
jgi:hypothetical protein